MTKTHTRVSILNMAVAFTLAVFALGALAPAASAHQGESNSGSSKVSVKPEQLQKDINKFLGKSLEKRNERSIQEKIRQVEKRIAELKKHLAAYEALLVKLQGVSSSTGTTTVNQ